MCANSGKSCPHVPIDDCVYILSQDLDVGVFHLCLCVYFHKTDIPQPFKPVVTDKVEVLTCFLNSCLQERFTNFPVIEIDKSEAFVGCQ